MDGFLSFVLASFCSKSRNADVGPCISVSSSSSAPPLLGRRRQPQSERQNSLVQALDVSTEPSPGEELDSPAAPGTALSFLPCVRAWMEGRQ